MNIIPHRFLHPTFRKLSTFGKVTLVMLSLLPVRSFAQPALAWDKTLGGGSWDELNGLLTLPDGIIAAGSTRSGLTPGNPNDLSWNFLIVKLDFDGNVLWQRVYGGDLDDRLWAIIPTSDGGFLAGGYAFSGMSGDKSQPSRGDMDVWVLKLDAQGQLLWERCFGGLYRDELFDMLELPGGGYLLGCNSWSDVWMDKSEASRGQQDFWLIRMDDQGNKLWDKTIGGDAYDQLNDLEWAPDGNVYVSGGTISVANTGELGAEPARGGMDFWLGKFDYNTKSLLWDHRYGGTGEDYAYALHVSQFSDKIYLGGRSGSGPAAPTAFNNGKDAPFRGGDSDYWLLDLDLNGNKILDRSFGGAGLDDLYAVQENPLGQLIIGGVSDSGISGNKTAAPRGGYDFWMLGLDAAGNILWQQSAGGTANDALTKIAFKPDGSFFAGGHSQSGIGFEKTENNLGLNDFWVLHFACDLKADIAQSGIPSACLDEPLLLDAEIPGCSGCVYAWNTGSTESAIEVPPGTQGAFSVAVYDEYGCTAFDTALIAIPPPPFVDLGSGDTLVGQGHFLVIGSENLDYQYLWNTGDTTATIRVSESGLYAVTVTDVAGCTGVFQIQVNLINRGRVWAPNVFSPNFDGYNDYACLFTDESVRRVLTFQIADRWGTLVFRRDDFPVLYETEGWDGIFDGKPAPPGVYAWFAEVEFLDGSRLSYEGSVAIVR